MARNQRKQVSIDFIEHAKKTINDLLASKIPQSAKYRLCVTMEKLLRDLKQDTSYKYLYWSRFGKLDWDAEKHNIFAKMTTPSSLNIPSSFIVGPDANDDPDFVSDIQGEYSRLYN